MAANTFDVAVQLKLMDELSGGLARPVAALQRMQRAIGTTTAEAGRQISVMSRLAAAYENMSMRAERAAQRMRALRGQAIGVAAGALGLAFPIAEAAQYEMALTRFGQVAQWTGGQHATNIRRVNETLAAVSAVTGQSTVDLVKAAATIQGIAGTIFETGGEFDFLKLETTMASVARWATAAGIQMDEAARAAVVMSQNAGLSADALARAFNVVTMGGKLGGFEAMDSARWFPELLSTYGIMMSGRARAVTQGLDPAAAQRASDALGLGMVANITTFLQMTRLGAADANIAANNLANIFQKMFIPETTRNIEKHLGIDFKRVMQEASLRGDDPVFEFMKILNQLIDKQGGNIFAVGDILGDRQALMGALPILNLLRNEPEKFRKLLADIRAAAGIGAGSVVMQDFLTTAQTLDFAYKSLRNSVKQFWNEIVLGGGSGVIGTVFKTIADGVLFLNQMLRSNPLLTKTVVQGGFGIAGALAGLMLLRFALAGVSMMFAHAGMAGVSLLNVIPGLGTILNATGVLGGVFGLLTRIGLIGGAGFLAYEYWDTLKPHIDPVLQAIVRFFERLTVLFPGLKGMFDGFGSWTGDVEHLIALLRQIGGDLFETISFLFGGGGDPAAVERLKNGLSGLFGSITQFFPALQSVKDWSSEFGGRLMFQGGIMDGLGAWGKMIATGFGVFSAWAVGTHGATGFLLILMAMRSALFVVGILVGAFQIIAILLSTIIAPLLESLMDRPWFRMIMAGAGIGLGILGIMLHQLGWKGTTTLIRSFWNRFTEETETGAGMFAASWNRLMRTIFGDDSSLARLMVTGESWGRMLGSLVNRALITFADALDYLSASLAGFQERHPNLYSFLIMVGQGWLAFAGAMAAVGASLWVIRSLAALSMIPAFLGLAGGVRGFFSGGSLIARGLRAMALGSVGLLARAAAGLVGMGPLGWAILLAGALVLVIAHLNEIKALFATANEWVNNSWLGKFMGLNAPTGERAETFTDPEGLLGQTRRLPTWDDIQRGNAEWANRVNTEGHRAASVLGQVADALATAAAKLAGIAGRPSPSTVDSASNGALHDAPLP